MFTEMPRNILISTRNENSSSNNTTVNSSMLEKPDMEFTEKEGKINMNRIRNLDLNTLFEPNNNILFQKILDNLISSKISNSDYDDIHKPLLLKSFQNILEYLVNKQNNIKRINNELNISKDKIQKRADELEQILKENKKIIDDFSKTKKDIKVKFEETKKKYEEMQKQEKENEKNKKNNKNIINTNINIVEIEKKTNIINTINQPEKIDDIDNNEKDMEDKKFSCKLCKDRYFPNKEELKGHIFRRHPKVLINNKKKLKEKKEENKFYKLFLKELDEFENFVKILISIYVKKEEKDKNEIMLEEIKKEIQDNYDKFENEQNQISDDLKKKIEEFTKIQNDFYNQLMVITGLKKGEEEIKEENEKKEKERILLKNALINLRNIINEIKLNLDNQNQYPDNKNNIIYLSQQIKSSINKLSVILEINGDQKNKKGGKNGEEEDKKEDKKSILKESNIKEEKEKEEEEEEKKEENEPAPNAPLEENNKLSESDSFLERVKRTSGYESNEEKINKKFINETIKENNININGGLNDNPNINKNKNKNKKRVLTREFEIKREQKSFSNPYSINEINL